MKTHKFKISLLMIAICMAISSVEAFGAGFTSLNDCIITSATGNYSYRPRGSKIGVGSGVLASAGHFTKDHTDSVCTGSYSNINQLRGLPAETIEDQLVSVKVQVTKHSGSDSDKWLLHEVEDGYRDGDMERLGLVTKGARLRNFGESYIFSLRGSGYSWISNYVVMEIYYADLDGSKPEPLEVIQAYLQKFPSTISASLVLDKTHDVTWIKDEMDRRLWLCDKWFYQLQLKKVEEKQTYQESVKSMNVFLDYREKYFGIKATDEKNLLAGYLNTNNGTGIKAKLTEYKNWWSVNKTKAISL